MRFTFTDPQVRDLKAKGKSLLPLPGKDRKGVYRKRDRIDHSDTKVLGLKLRVSKSGGCSYRLELWRGLNERDRRIKEVMVLGNARHMSVDEARDKATEALKRREQDGDKLNAQRAQRDQEQAKQAASTFEKAWQRFMSEHVEGGEAPLRPRTAVAMRRAYKRVAHWAPRPLAKISDDDILAVTGKLKAEGKLPTAGLLRAHLSSFFSWAVGERLIKISPVPAKPRRRRTAEHKQTGTTLSVEQLRTILMAAKALQDPRHQVFVEVLVMSGTRRFETSVMRREDVDLDKGTWTIPASIAKNGRQHTVFLPPQLVAELRELPGNARYFFSTAANGFANYSRLKAQLDELIRRECPGFASWTWHDLRRSMASGLGDMGFPPHEIEAALNHATGSRTSLGNLYNRSGYTERTKIAWAAWADRLANDVPANVIPLRA